MTNEETKNLIEEKMAEVPEYIREAIDSSDWERKIFNIGRKYQLHVDDLAELQEELELAMIGLSDQDEFEDKLHSMGISNETIDGVVTDINDQIFSHIREKIKEYHEEPEENDDEINAREREVLHKSGVRLGDEADEPEPVEAEEKSTPTKSDEVEKETLVSVASEGKPVAPIQKPVEAPEKNIFKTKTTEIASTDKPKNYFDPYREPIE